ncbi:MAG: AAA family ATPase [Opitutae bacterium]|nr:AAA family ATPase [Opitutae bacterium]
MVKFSRILDLDLPTEQSAFLWGARKTGKSTYLQQKYPHSLVYDFLKTDLFIDFHRRPFLLREQLLARKAEELAHPIILDEVQKVPTILDEVHWLIENRGLQFVLCGSSARKLKRGQANLLGGRAWRFEMHPLVSVEVGELDLLKALNRGLIPDHYLQNRYHRSLAAYARDYMKEEVFDEGLTRNIPAFTRFFDALGYSHGEVTNFSNIARDCGIDAKTVRAYYEILVDTHLGRWVEPYTKRTTRQIITKSPKFYLFDVGIAGCLSGRQLEKRQGAEFGKAFEHLMLMELAAYNSYRELHFPIRFWRTKSGLEVDYVLGAGEVAIEVKSSRRIDRRDFRGIKAFRESYKPCTCIIVCQESTRREVDEIAILPWREFLSKLWGDEIIH